MSQNPLLAPLNTLIDYADVQPQHIVSGIEQLIDSNKQLNSELCKEPDPTWENFVDPLQAEGERLSRAISVTSHLQSVNNTEEIRQAYESVLPQISAYSSWWMMNEDIFRQYERIKNSKAFAELNPLRQRIVNETLKEFRLNGVALDADSKKKRAEMNARLSELTQRFAMNVLDATDSWSYVTENEAELKGLPQDAVTAARSLADKNEHKGWEFSLQMPSFLPVIKYADSGKLRETLYRGRQTLASDQGDTRHDNSQLMSEILKLRQAKSHQLGYKNYADITLEDRMADSTEEVLAFLRELAAKAKPYALREVEEVKKFAAENLSMSDLQPWDYAYVSEKLQQHLYSFSEEEIKEYLPQDKVFEGLFSLIQKLYGVVFRPVSGVSVWHDKVQVFEVVEQDNVIGYLYTDLYARNGKQNGAWVGTERSRYKLDGELLLPVAYLICNFGEAVDGKPALLRHDDVLTLFHEMGHALHALLTKVDEPSSAGINGVEWDAVELPSQFMENFCWEWSVMSELTAHWKTGESMPKELFDKLYKARNFQSGMAMLRQIEFALFDMLLHTQDESPDADRIQKILREVRTEVAVLESPEWSRFAHQFSHIFAGGYAAGYYSYKWAEVLSADAYGYFEENATEAEGPVNRKSGEHFKKTVLEVGSSQPAKVFFKQFRGRDATPEALLRHSGLTDDAKVAAES